MKGSVFLVHLNITVYAFAFWFTKPAFPYLSRALGADETVFGYLQFVFSAAQLVGGPIMGRLIDTKGAKFSLMLSQLSGGSMYLLMAYAAFTQSMPGLFLSQTMTLGMHAMHAAQTSTTLLSSKENRAESLGRLSFSYGIGMVLAPSLGGTVARHYGHGVTSLVAGLLSVGITVATHVLLPDVSGEVASEDGEELREMNGGKATKKAKEETKAKGDGSLNLGEIWRIFASFGVVRSLLLIKLLAAVALSILRMNFAFNAQERFGVDEQMNGFIMTLVGSISMLTNTFVIGFVTKRVPDKQLIPLCLALMGVAFFPIDSVETLPAFLGTVIPLSAAGAIVSTTCTSRLTKSVEAGDTGTVLGLDMAVNSLARLAAPVLSGQPLVVETLGIGVFGALTCVLGLLFGLVALAGVDDRAEDPKKDA